MITLHKSKSQIAIVVMTALFLSACTEQEAENTQTTTVGTTVVKEEKEGNVIKWQREAQNGDPDAQYNLAYLYENGLEGLPKDEAKALELYQQAADQGHSAAQSNLNAMSLSK
jgi:TPR repeat protein